MIARTATGSRRLSRAGTTTTWRGLVALGCVALSLGLASCGAEGEGDASDTSSAVDDAGVSDGDQAGADSGGSADSASAADTAGPEPAFELGTNVTGKNTPPFYSALAEGGTVNVELGPQGLWMVVLAFKTRAMFTPPLFLSGDIVVTDHDTAGSLKLKKQKVFPGGDGFDYYYNFWLVVKKPDGSFPVGVAGKKAVVTFEVTDADNKVHKVVRNVSLTGGPKGG